MINVIEPLLKFINVKKIILLHLTLDCEYNVTED